MSDSFRESPAEREQRIRERADEARPNVSLTPGQAETLTQSAAHVPFYGGIPQPPAYPYLWSQQSGGWWGNHPIPCRILRDEGSRVKIAALRPDGVELERFVKKERLRRA